MKIVSLHIVAFGKLTNVNLQFKQGINVLKQANSFGKTTIANFIRAMLYGFAYTRKQGVSDVSHFAPWDGTGKFGGSLVVEHNGTTYRIERFFGATARSETLSVINEKTGKAQDWEKSPGETLLGLTADSYDRSAYFPQEAVAIETNENLDSKLANLVEDGAEDYDKVQDKLRAYKRTLRHERGNGGQIYELECKQRALSEQLSRAQDAERRATEIDQRLQAIAQERANLIEQQAQYNEQLSKLRSSATTQSVAEPQKQRAHLLYVGIALLIVGAILLALGVMKVLGAVGYVLGAVCVIAGVVCVTLNFARRTTPSAQQSDALNDETATRNAVNAITALTDKLAELAMETGRLSEERKALTFNSVEIMDQLLTVEAQRKEAIHRYEVAEVVAKLLEQAKDNLSSGYLPRLCARCSELLRRITDSDFSVVADRNFTLHIRENGQTKPIGEFSRGIREITLLCFRVALLELLYDGAIPFVIVDDAFVNFDEDNFLRATALLKDLSANAQVIYFTCHDRIGNLQ